MGGQSALTGQLRALLLAFVPSQQNTVTQVSPAVADFTHIPREPTEAGSHPIAQGSLLSVLGHQGADMLQQGVTL